jgi:tubulysin polyketide synthase-like protein
MTAPAFIESFAARGFSFLADGGKLIVSPASALTDEDRQAIREHKAELLDLLADENIEMHDSALFDVVVEVDFYDGTRLRIPQQSTPEGWEAPF